MKLEGNPDEVMRRLVDVDWSKIPAPEDDGAADHLRGMTVPSVSLESTRGGAVDLSKLVGVSVVYIYPMTARPGGEMPEGWEEIPGARGCTPQACAFRDHVEELRRLGVSQLFGLSTQSVEDLQEASDWLHLPYPLLSDRERHLQRALRLPELEVEGWRLLKRLTLILRDDRIEQCFYPVFPPTVAPQQVSTWLRSAERDGS